jgi:lysophospholipid acyltransferase (LPLAT)-like uncharacterized protein
MKVDNYEKDSESLNFASISKYSLKEKVLIYLIDFGLYSFMKTLGKTIRFDTSHKSDNYHDGWKSMEQFTTDKPLCIAVFWHDRILLTTYFWRFSNYAAMVSESFDGEYIARISQRFGHGMARGSSTRGGTKALRIMKNLLKKEKFSLTLTIDGPKGPRYKVKSGAILLAKITGVPIVPILIQPKKFWTVNSWDKLQIPKPFTKAKVFVAEPIFVSKASDKNDLETKRQEVQIKLDELVEIGEQWRDSKN